MLHKATAQECHRKDYTSGAYSYWIFWRTVDGTSFKTTEFHAPTGWAEENIVGDANEVIRVRSGVVKITQGGTVELHPGGSCYIPAGEPYSMEVIEELVADCFFSAVVGPLPE